MTYKKKKRNKVKSKTSASKQSNYTTTSARPDTQYKLNQSDLLRDRRQELEKKSLRRQTLRQIREDFAHLLNKGTTCEVNEVAEFIGKYDQDLDLVEEVFRYHQSVKSLPITILKQFFQDKSNQDFDQLILEQKFIAKRKDWLAASLPRTIVVPVEVTESGPEMETITQNTVHQIIEKFLGERVPQLKFRGDFQFRRPGKYELQIEFPEGIVVSQIIQLELQQEELPANEWNHLEEISPIPLPNTTKVLDILHQSFTDTSQDEILEYYPIWSSVLLTAYQEGYWRVTWIQDLLREWRSRRAEYFSSLRLRNASRIIDQIDCSGPWLVPEKDDTAKLEKQRVIAIVDSILSNNEELSTYDIELRFDGDTNQTVIPVEIFLEGRYVGKLRLLRSALFLPANVREEIQLANIDGLGDLQSCISEQRLLEVADIQTKNALNITNDQGRPDHLAKAQLLSGVCRILLSRGLIHHVQFKRTLTSYFAARGSELFFGNDPLKARNYFLLFFQMLYKEKMLEHMKANREFEYPVLANLFGTYLTGRTRNTRIPAKDIIWSNIPRRLYRDISDQSSMIWRSAQLLNESFEKFFEALFDLYTIDEDFVRNLLASLRRFDRISNLSVEALNADSIKLRKDLIVLSIEKIPLLVSTDLLVSFVFSFLDVKDIGQQVLTEFERILTPTRQFVNARDIVHKSTLYTDIDREFLRTRAIVDRLANASRHNELTRKKASRLRRLLEEIKVHVDRIHHEFFSSAKLEVEINTFTLPRNERSPVEFKITNIDFGPASSVVIKISKNPSFDTQVYTIPLNPIFGKDECFQAVYLSPVTGKTIELRGTVEYSDQESEKKVTPFRHTISVSEPADFKPFRSPYITGGPVRKSEMFFGRRGELNEIIHLLIGHFQDRITVIHGRRRVGKTSILFQLAQGTPNLLQVPTLELIRERYIPVLIDFERFTTEKPTWEVYYHIYSTLRQELEVREFTIETISLRDFRDLPADALLGEFFLNLERILISSEKKLLLMFDEFDTLIRNKGEETGLFGFIRELIIKHGPYMSFIFVGADQLVGMMKKRTSRLYSMAGTPIEIANLTWEEAKQLVTEPMRDATREFEWAEEAIQLILEVTGRNPYYMQTLCDRIVNNLIVGKRSRATVIDVEQGVRESVNHIGDLADIINGLESNEERVILTCIAELTHHERMEREWTTSSEIEDRLKTITHKFPADIIPSTLRNLQIRYILDQLEDEDLEMKYSIKVPLLQVYIENQLKLGDVLREGNYL